METNDKTPIRITGPMWHIAFPLIGLPFIGLGLSFYMRFFRWDELSQGAHVMLTVMAAGIGLFFLSIGWLLRRMKFQPKHFFVIPLAWLLVSAIQFALMYETEQGRIDRNNHYLLRSAEIVIEYQQANGTIPDGFDTALSASPKRLPCRGDADGNSMLYTRLGPDSFEITSTNPRIFVRYENGKLVHGK